MQLNSKDLLNIKRKFKEVLKSKDVLDIVLFGSTVKGKALPKDIDAAIISEIKKDYDIEGVHLSLVSPFDFFRNPSAIVTTLIREGFSLRENKSLSECWRFKSGILFSYQLSGLNNSSKVKIVNLLRGKNGSGMISEYGGEWVSTGVFIAPVSGEHIFDSFFRNFSIKYKKRFVLMH